MMQYNNQPIVGVLSFDDERAEARPGRSVWGGCHGIILDAKQAKTTNKKYSVTLDGCCLMIIY